MPLVACDLFRRDGYDSIMAQSVRDCAASIDQGFSGLQRLSVRMLRYIDELIDDATEGFPQEAAADAPST